MITSNDSDPEIRSPEQEDEEKAEVLIEGQETRDILIELEEARPTRRRPSVGQPVEAPITSEIHPEPTNIPIRSRFGSKTLGIIAVALLTVALIGAITINIPSGSKPISTSDEPTHIPTGEGDARRGAGQRHGVKTAPAIPDVHLAGARNPAGIGRQRASSAAAQGVPFFRVQAIPGTRTNTGDSDHGDKGVSGESQDDRDHSDTEKTPGEEELRTSGRDHCMDGAATPESFQLDVRNPDIRDHSQESESRSSEAEDPKAQGIGKENESPSRAQKRRRRRKNVRQSQRKQALEREAELSAIDIILQQNQDREMLKMTMEADMEKVEDRARRQAELEKFLAEHLDRKQRKSDEDDAKRYPHNPRSVATGPVEQPKQSSFFGTLMKPRKNSPEKAEKLREQKQKAGEEEDRKKAAAEALSALRYLPGIEAHYRADLKKKLGSNLGYFLSKYQEWMFKEASLKSIETRGRRHLEEQEAKKREELILDRGAEGEMPAEDPVSLDTIFNSEELEELKPHLQGLQADCGSQPDDVPTQANEKAGGTRN